MNAENAGNGSQVQSPGGRLQRWGRRLGRLLGAERDPSRRLGWRFRLRFFLLAALLLLVAGGGGILQYTNSPSFCRSCHIMEPYYQAWAASTHKDVACVECHYSPEKSLFHQKFRALSQVATYVTGTYSSKPYTEIDDSSCLRSGCHATNLLRGPVSGGNGVRFDHQKHLENKQMRWKLRCTSCHSQVEVGTHMETSWHTCFLCHLKDHDLKKDGAAPDRCLGCHAIPDKVVQVGNITYNHKTFLGQAHTPCQSCHQDSVRGSGQAEPDRCQVCHNQPEKLARYGETDALHEIHVSRHNTACYQCHQEVHHGASHAGSKTLALACDMCHVDSHSIQRELYLGKGARDIESMPSPMYLANVDCVGCHRQEKLVRETRERTYLGTEQGCIECHGEKYRGMLVDMHENMRGAIKVVTDKLEAINRGLPSDWGERADLAPQRKELESISHNVSFLVRAHAVHNIYYASQILREADSKLTLLARKLDVKTEGPSDHPVLTGGFCATLCHVRVGVKVPPDEVTFEGKVMKHQTHAEEGLPCTSCHIFRQHKQVSLKRPTRCNRCHEEDEEEK